MAKAHSQDTILVRNIDVNCKQVTYDVVPAYRKEIDEETGESYQRFDNYPYEFNHSEYFAVRWAGQLHQIKPGETRLMPRFLAEHYAKHLADHMLGKRELAEKKTGYVTSAIERPKVLAEILVQVVQRFENNGTDDEGLQALEQVQEINSLNFGSGDFAKAAGKGRELGELNVGSVADKAAGVLTNDTPESLDDVLAAAGEKVEAKPLPTRPELIKEAHALGIKVDATDTREILANKIKAF